MDNLYQLELQAQLNRDPSNLIQLQMARHSYALPGIGLDKLNNWIKTAHLTLQTDRNSSAWIHSLEELRNRTGVYGTYQDSFFEHLSRGFFNGYTIEIRNYSESAHYFSFKKSNPFYEVLHLTIAPKGQCVGYRCINFSGPTLHVGLLESDLYYAIAPWEENYEQRIEKHRSSREVDLEKLQVNNFGSLYDILMEYTLALFTFNNRDDLLPKDLLKSILICNNCHRPEVLNKILGQYFFCCNYCWGPAWHDY